MVEEEWIKSEKSLSFITLKSHKSIDELTPPQILSTLMLGEVVDLIRAYEIESVMFDLRKIKFKKYHWSNREFCLINGKKSHISELDKNIIVLNLLRTISNRAFHWENLLKTRERRGEKFPRITHRENGTVVGVMPTMILCFLNDLINTIDNEEINKNTRKTLGI